jgi:uncharacterized protein
VLNTVISGEVIAYTGEQFQEGWLTARFGVKCEGEGCAAAFLGPCNVLPEFMVDLEDLAGGCAIYSAMMLHFIIESPGTDLAKAVLQQRLLVCVTRDLLNEHVGALRIVRRGSDLYDGARKLSISVATVAENSALIHFAMNTRMSGYPLPVQGLSELGIVPEELAGRVLSNYCAELESMRHAEGKVKRVGVWRGTP